MNKKLKPLSLAFIGGAVSSAVGYAHFSACKMDNKFSIVAGCFSRRKEETLKTANIYGIDINRTYTDWKELLKKEKNKIDAVVILTPTPSHSEIVFECLKMRIPVICEKTLAMNSDEIKKIKNIIDKTNGFLIVTYNYSGYPMIRELKNLIINNKLGKILHFQAEMPQEGYLRIDSNGNKIYPQTWRLKDKKVPTIYLDLAIHLHQLIHYLIDEKPIRVIADQATDGFFKNIIDNVSCLCRYTNNIQGQFWFSKSALGHRNGMKIGIYGTKASAQWIQINPEEIILSFNDGSKQILDRANSYVSISNQKKYNRFKSGHPAGFIEAFSNLYSDIYDALINYKKSGKWNSKELFNENLSLEGLKFLEAMVKSTHTQKWEKIK